MSLDLLHFEINTDANLVEPDWNGFVEQHEERYGLAIHHLKSLVEGETFDNEAVRLRVGPGGFYLQSRRFPAHFYGGTERPDLAFVTEDEAHAIVWEAHALYRAGEVQSLTSIHSDDDPSDAFFGYRLGGGRCYELGRPQPGLPLHLRAMLDGVAANDLVGPKGVLVYQRTEDGRHLVLRRSGLRPPLPPAASLQG